MENIITTKTTYQPDSAIFIDESKTTINVKVIEEFKIKNWEGVIQSKENTFVRTIRLEPSETLTEFLSQVELQKVEENTSKTNALIIEQNTEVESRLKKDIFREIDKNKTIGNIQNNPVDLTNMTEESLFKLKLQSFEIEEVKNSTNRELKSSLRKSASFMEAVAYTVALILDK
tara:strand:- start:1704 stop:2225 length:522 start_codon:yes stop_codon:yes gene_type:complete